MGRICPINPAFLLGSAFGICITLFYTVDIRNPASVNYERFKDFNHAENDRIQSQLNSRDNLPEKPQVSLQNNPKEAEDFIPVRVLCWVLTTPANHKKKAIHIKKTWGRRCNKLLFMSSADDLELGAVDVSNYTENRNYLWPKTKAAFIYVWEHHRNDAEWFLKADDDTFVVLENLRHFLLQYSPEEPLYFGCHYTRPNFPWPWPAGGSGYVLSKEALRRFVEVSQTPRCSGVKKGQAEDVEMGKCLYYAGVVLEDSRDAWGKHRFLALGLEEHLFPKPKRDYWYWNILQHPQEHGSDCCSDTAVAFHYVKPGMMYVLEYIIYHLRPIVYANSEVYDIHMEEATAHIPRQGSPG